MSKELIERLKSYIPSGDGHNSQYANDLADAVAILEAKAAPVGEREAFEAWAASVGYHTERDMFQREKYQSSLTWELWRVWQAGAAYQRAQQPQSAEAVAQCTNEDSWNCKYCRKTENCAALKDPRNFATPQPSAGVVMPHRLRGAISMVLTALDRDALNGRPARGEMADELREAIDEFARLNGKEVGRG